MGTTRRIARMLRGPAAAGAVLSACALAATGSAAQPSATGFQLGAERLSAVKDSELDSALARLGRAKDVPAAAARLGLAVDGDRIRVEVHTEGAAGKAVSAVQAAGGSVTARYGGLVEATVPAGQLAELAAAAAVTSVQPVAKPTPAVVTGEGVLTTGALGWIAAGNAGSGVKVAVIDVGFGGWDARRAEGELPADVVTADFCSMGGFDADAPTHGTAVAEIVHEVAPAAQLHLVCADSLGSLGAAKNYAKAKGIHVVNHSVGWHNTARGDGAGGPVTPDGIAADARANGILWVNAAGNEAGRHWSGTFADGDGDGWHEFEFAPEVTFEGNGVVVPKDEQFCAYLRWDDWPASAQDYDLYLYGPKPASAQDFVARSTNTQSGTQAPVEELCYTNPNPQQQGGAPNLYLAIRKHSATAAPRFDLFTSHDFVRPGFGGMAVADGSLLEPAASPNVLTVTAVCWNDTNIEPFSSRGPTLDPAVLKPDVAAPDGVSSVTEGPFHNCGVRTSGFFGTSAAAPHVAGAAALVKQANPAFTPAQLQAELESRTADFGLPGQDTIFGAGLLALGLVPAGQNPPPGAPANAAAPAISGVPQQGRTLTASTGAWTGAPTVFAYQWRRCLPSGACSDIDAALGASYTVVAADVDGTLRVQVTAINGGGGTAATSPATTVVTPLPPQSSAAPTITGSARVGSSLTASTGSWTGMTPITYSVEWQRCDQAGANCGSTGASGTTYAPTAADLAARLRVVVTATNRGGSASSSSAPTAAVSPSAPQNVTAPTVNGTARAGETLTASTGSWRDAASYSYRWWRCVRTACAYVDGATASSFALRDADVGATFRAVVTATNATGSASAHSAATAVVARRVRLSTGLAGSTLRTTGRAVAGVRFAVTMTVIRKKGTSLRGQLGCSARIGRYVVPRTQRVLKGNVARCAWLVPRWAAGRRLTGTVRVHAAGNSVTRRFGVLVKSRS